MSNETTLNGVKVSYKPKSEKKSDVKSSDKPKRTYYEKGGSKPSKPSRSFKQGGRSSFQKKVEIPKLDLSNNARFCAIEILLKIERGQSLSDLLMTELKYLNDNDKRFTQHLVYGALRQFDVLEYQLATFLQKPIKTSERQVSLALILALYELTEMKTAEYAAVNNWVTLIRQMNKEWAVGLTNGILRKVLREGLPSLPENITKASMPKWLALSLMRNWGKDRASLIAQYFMMHPPMTIRINPLQSSRDAYGELLDQQGIEFVNHAFIASAITLKDAVSVSDLPNFVSGMSSVQDGSAQLAAKILDPQDNEVIIDACAAPGGKTIAMLEWNQNLSTIYAIDSVESRLGRVQENLQRVFPMPLMEKVQLIATDFSSFNAPKQVDAILLDVPCSATGIIHRHPDIKRLRKPSDIKTLAQTQMTLLEHAWKQLKAGGRLLYSTCSILKEENEYQMQDFFERHDDASEVELSLPFAQKDSHGYQILPIYGELDQKLDGFFYCLIQKSHE